MPSAATDRRADAPERPISRYQLHRACSQLQSWRRHLPTWRLLATEAVVLFAMYFAYTRVRHLIDGQIDAAQANAAMIWDIERFLQLPDEAKFQDWLLGVAPIAKLANYHYTTVHFPATVALLVWLFWRSRSAYIRVRTELVLLTASGMVVHALFPLAPPRLADGLNIVDTMNVFGPSPYPPPEADGLANQYAAMPSLHVGWALLLALAVTRVATSPARWLIWLHPTVTLLVVVVTANHYWLDGILVAVLFAGAYALARVLASRPWHATLIGRRLDGLAAR